MSSTNEQEATLGMVGNDLDGLIELSREHSAWSKRLREALEGLVLAYGKGNVQKAQLQASEVLSGFNAWVQNNEESGPGHLANLAQARRHLPSENSGS